MLKPFFIRHEKLLKRIDPQKVVGLYTEGNYTKILLFILSTTSQGII
jgi:hypothetical protein